jgi:hypothetical protein
MSKGVEAINDSIAASLVLQGLAKKQGIAASSKSFFGGTSNAYDIIVDKIHNWQADGKFAFFSYYAVKVGKSKSATRVFTEVVLKDVLNKLFNEALGGVSEVYSMGDSLSGAYSSVAKNEQKKAVKDIYSKANKLGGQMQLHEAKKMGGRAYKETVKYGISSDFRNAGIVRFEQLSYGGGKGLNIVLRGWTSRSRASYWIDHFNGHTGNSPVKNMNDLQNFGGDIKIDYMYNPANGVMW